MSADGLGVEKVYQVDRVRCGWQRMALRGGIVVSAPSRGTRADRIRSMYKGQRAVMVWSVGWKGVLETIGGNPTLIEDGKVVVGRSSHPFFRRNPRTGIGYTGDRVLLVTVDGRQRRYSVGMTLRAFAQLFKSLGARWALNMDGGGSTTMVVRGGVVNRPSDGSERPVSSALLVMPRSGAYMRSAAAATTQSATSPWSDVVEDAGSTGGISSWVAGKEVRLPDVLDRTARIFGRGR
jgi:hypothetical protein